MSMFMTGGRSSSRCTTGRCHSLCPRTATRFGRVGVRMRASALCSVSGIVGNKSDPLPRQPDREAATSAGLAVDDQFALMPDQHVLHDREAQPGAAGGPGTAAIDAVEALGQPWHVFRGDADAVVRDR